MQPSHSLLPETSVDVSGGAAQGLSAHLCYLLPGSLCPCRHRNSEGAGAHCLTGTQPHSHHDGGGGLGSNGPGDPGAEGELPGAPSASPLQLLGWERSLQAGWCSAWGEEGRQPLLLFLSLKRKLTD